MASFQDTHKSGDFFGQEPPGDTLKPFCPELFSIQGEYRFHLHTSLYFTSDGTEVYFTNQKVPVKAGYDQTILFMKKQNGRWSKPQSVAFSGEYSDQIFFLSPDGNRIYFTSTRPLNGKGDALDSRNGWIAQRTESGWSEPLNIASPMDLKNDDGALFVSANWPGGKGLSDVYMLNFANENYGMPENLGAPINSEWDEYACCVPKELNFLIFYRFHPNDRDIRGLYLSFQEQRESWTKPVSLSGLLELRDGFSATFSPDEKYLFILNRGDGMYWIETQTAVQLVSDHVRGYF
jgi:hypothetical protein